MRLCTPLKNLKPCSVLCDCSPSLLSAISNTIYTLCRGEGPSQQHMLLCHQSRLPLPERSPEENDSGPTDRSAPLHLASQLIDDLPCLVVGLAVQGTCLPAYFSRIVWPTFTLHGPTLEQWVLDMVVNSHSIQFESLHSQNTPFHIPF